MAKPFRAHDHEPSIDDQVKRLKAIVEAQAKDNRLWYHYLNETEISLQDALFTLHAAIKEI